MSNGTIRDRLMSSLTPFIGSEICQENIEKMKTLILRELPYLNPDDLTLAIEGILKNTSKPFEKPLD